ncbi:MAG: hypothetical protein HGA85_03120 [Nanoarchaeota archaeon]|nr:hypothetical protein [Nanoarchaeota archaeon]
MNLIKTFIDVDGVILLPHTPLVTYVNRHHLPSGTVPFTNEDITDWGFGRLAKTSGLDWRQCVDILHDIYRTDPRSIPIADEHVVETINWLLGNTDSYLLSANAVPDGLTESLRYHGVRTDRLIFNGQKEAFDFQVAVEDNPTYKPKDSQILILRDQPWNRYLPADIRRIYDSIELPGIISELRFCSAAR